MTSYESRQRRAHLKGIVPSHTEAVARVKNPGDLAIVRRGTLRSAVMCCPDGCGEAITLNLDPRTDKAWRLYQSPKGVTLFPSVWRDTGCQSHFVLWNDTIYWVDIFDVDVDNMRSEEQLKERVLTILRSDALTDYVEIADALGEIPWAVLNVCRRLVRAKRAVAGTGSMKTSFKRF
jgi:Family of unknown function (DUF6527)